MTLFCFHYCGAEFFLFNPGEQSSVLRLLHHPCCTRSPRFVSIRCLFSPRILIFKDFSILWMTQGLNQQSECSTSNRYVTWSHRLGLKSSVQPMTPVNLSHGPRQDRGDQYINTNPNTNPQKQRRRCSTGAITRRRQPWKQHLFHPWDTTDNSHVAVLQ